MRAVVCRTFADLAALTVEDVPTPQPGQEGIVVAVRAAGVTFPDLLMVEDKYQVKPGLPFVVGTEIAGVVAAVGANVRDLAVGDHVAAKVPYGGFAELALVANTGRAQLIPRDLDFQIAASFPSNYCTSLYALRHRAGLKAGETLMVLGASGGVGLAAVEIGKHLGARVIACAGSAAKLEVARAHGADALVNYDEGDFRAAIKAAAGAKAPNVILDVVGGGYADPAFREIAWGGRYLAVGFASGEIPRLAFNLALLKSASLVGVSLGGAARNEPAVERQCMADLAQWIAAGQLKPYISARYPLEHAGRALADLKERRAVGKIVLVP